MKKILKFLLTFTLFMVLLLLFYHYQDSISMRVKELLVTVMPGLDYYNDEVYEKKQGNTEIKTVSADLYVYQQLTNNEKLVYDQIVDLLLKQEESAVISTTDSDLITRIMDAALADHPEIFWVENYAIMTYSQGDKVQYLEIKPTYTMSDIERADYQKTIDDYTNDCLSGIPADADEYQKVKYIYEYIIKNTAYDERSQLNQNICSVMAYHSSVCMGYAKSMQYLLNQIGILSVTVSGKTSEGSHAWNLVRVEGEYYYVDVTWGDMQHEGNSSLNTDVNYAYLCVTTEELLLTHTPQVMFELQPCTSMASNYYIREGCYLEEFSENAIKEMVERFQDAPTLSIKCKNQDVYYQLYQYLIEEGQISRYISSRKVKYLEMPEKGILTIRL